MCTLWSESVQIFSQNTIPLVTRSSFCSRGHFKVFFVAFIDSHITKMVTLKVYSLDDKGRDGDCYRKLVNEKIQKVGVGLN